MKKLTKPATRTDGPLVSVLIPARNEEQLIEACLNSLLNQNYLNYEILVLDDNSSDGTMAILKRMASEHSRIRVFKGEPLHADWYGKPFALQQLSAHAKGEILIFTDADTIHQPTSISWAVSNMDELKADFVSGYIGQDVRTFGEKMTVPLMYLLTGFIVPLFLNRLSKASVFSTAVGQYIAVKSDVFKKNGGYEAVKKKTSEDIYLARYIKSLGYKTMFLDISNQVCCRMYSGYTNAVHGIGKNIFDFFNKNSLVLFIAVIAVFLFLLCPFPLLFYFLITGNPYTIPLIIVNILYTLDWLMLFIDRKITWYYALLWPLLFINLLYMAGWSWFRTVSGKGFVWKERVVT
ncbi:glycosyltransferase family 2 protein [Brucepastera parasyntrophica]|uniref:glycosyltransferase n=1 Tax=Brucepastera parasyntrophica TaxID=2880008 RepID=UPI00210E7152|nr:glycosyltransferase family 2 protein [Brucepastera parasyntrophica]ULQ58756.1 glycosyltransferase family 2 protein [Brucepastera parasyntrophica]